jgi:acyl-CoA synthetase (NDP forming)
MDKLLNPRTIAILGCSENNTGGMVLKNLLFNKFHGELFPVHPRNDTVFGIKCFGSLDDIQEEIDVCVVALRNDLVLPSIEEMNRNGVKAAVFFASGFSEVGENGAKLEQEVADKLNEYGIVACGPNCLGLINLHNRSTLYSAAADLENSKGNIGLVSHSGSVCIALSGANRGVGFSFLVSSGNEVNLTVADYFRAMLDHDETHILAGFLETVRDPQQLGEVAMLAMKRNKPILVLKVGRSEIARLTAAAHSGALAGSSDFSDAYFLQNNILQVSTLDELLEACELFYYLKEQRVPETRKIAMTAISGGQLGYCSDIALEQGVEFADISQETRDRISAALPNFATAKNPLDVTTALFDAHAYKECLLALASDEEVGMLVICQDAEKGLSRGEIQLYGEIIKTICQVKREVNKPVVVFSPLASGLVQEFSDDLNKVGIPLLQGTRESFASIRLYFDWIKMKQQLHGNIIKPANNQIPKFDLGSSSTLSESESKRLLRHYGIGVAEDILVANPDDAILAARKLGYPVALKVDSPDIQHKTEARIVKLNVDSDDSVKKNYNEILRNAELYNPSARINGVSVQEMVPEGIELILGGKVDPVFGPAVLVGSGGIYVEVLKDYSLRLAPFKLEIAYEMIDSLKGKSILYGARGKQASDIDALAETLVKLSYLMADLRNEIRELDINPVLLHGKGEGLKAVDALVIK